MRTGDPQMSMTGACTGNDRSVGTRLHLPMHHDGATQEHEPVGMLIEPDPNCPLHGTNRDAGSTRAV